MTRLAPALLAVLLLAPPAAAQPLRRVVFPDDPKCVIDARRDLGAKGDGLADDTDALQKGLDLTTDRGKESAVLYLPNGTYKVTRTLVAKRAVGPWVYGESRDGVVVRLADGAKECNSVLRTHPNEAGHTSADWFMRNLRNFTIDVGNNPETDGIRYFATNSGTLRNVRVVGRGKVGINAGFLGQSGPNLIRDVEVDGFETGIRSQWIWGETISGATVRNCRKVGLEVSANVAAVENLVVENTPLPVLNNIPNDWHWWSGTLALIGGRFSGGDASGPAVENKGVLYARDVKTTGFKSAIRKAFAGADAPGPDVTEYTSHPVKSLFDSPPAALQLPIKSEPDLPWETDPAKWVCANDFGATYGDRTDDTAAIQKAIDAAAAAGKTTVYLRGIGGGDPNWYTVDGEVRVHGSVRHILGLGFGRILGGKGGKFVVGDDAAPVVKFKSIDSFGGPPVTIEHRSARSTVIVESCGVNVLGTGRGDLFLSDCPASLDLRNPAQNVWCRQLNPEGDSDTGLVRNAGATLWILGMKCEGRGVRVNTTAGGRTEVIGTFIYGPGIKEGDRRPIFEVTDARLSVVGLREIAFGGHCYFVKVKETRGGVTRELGSDREGGWIGWSLYSGRAD